MKFPKMQGISQEPLACQELCFMDCWSKIIAHNYKALMYWAVVDGEY
jgi:hypothetical protein